MRRVVHISSLAAIQTYDKPKDHVFTEKDWNDWSGPANGDYYGLAKTKAEEIAHRRAEKAMERKENSYDVVVLNPSVVLGTCFTKVLSVDRKHTFTAVYFRLSDWGRDCDCHLIYLHAHCLLPLEMPYVCMSTFNVFWETRGLGGIHYLCTTT